MGEGQEIAGGVEGGGLRDRRPLQRRRPAGLRQAGAGVVAEMLYAGARGQAGSRGGQRAACRRIRIPPTGPRNSENLLLSKNRYAPDGIPSRIRNSRYSRCEKSRLALILTRVIATGTVDGFVNSIDYFYIC